MITPLGSLTMAFEQFFRHFNKLVPLTPEEEAAITPHLSIKHLKKKEILLRQGEVCRQIAFVNQGVLRAYLTDENGTEHIRQFAPEDWTISDLFSFITGEPGTLTIDALEDAEVVLISKHSHDELLETCTQYETFTRIRITNAYVALQRRFNSTLSTSLEDQYLTFISTYPDIALRVPQHMIASYLGLTPSTISRIRARLVKHKA